MLWSCLYLRGTEEIVKNFCRVWCIASLIGLSPILAVAVLRVNALSPLLTSLAGSSPALVLRVSWDGPTPFCFGIVFTYWSAVLHCSFFRFRLTARRTTVIHHKPVRLFCRCMCSSYFSEYGCPGRWLWQWRLLRGQLWQLFRVLISTFELPFFYFPGIAGGRDFLTAGSSSSVVFVLLFIHAFSPLLVLQHFTDFPFQIQHNGFSFRFGCFPRDC